MVSSYIRHIDRGGGTRAKKGSIELSDRADVSVFPHAPPPSQGKKQNLGDGNSLLRNVVSKAGIYRMDKQQGPTVGHKELYSISCDKP